jgi:hypothetical protein
MTWTNTLKSGICKLPIQCDAFENVSAEFSMLLDRASFNLHYLFVRLQFSSK